MSTFRETLGDWEALNSNLKAQIADLPDLAKVQQSFEAIMKGREPLVLFRTLAASPRAWEKFRAGSLLDRGPLSLREREIVIDRTCARTGCEYEWGVHIAAFAQAAKLTDEQVRATVLGKADAACWSEAEQVLIATTDALHDRATLSEAEFAALAAHYDEAKIFEIIQLCGFYRTVSYLANALALRLRRLEAMRQVAEQLFARSQLDRDVFGRGLGEPIAHIRNPEWSATLYDLLSAYAAQRQRHALGSLHYARRKVWSLAEAREALERLIGNSEDWSRLDEYLLAYVVEPSLKSARPDNAVIAVGYRPCAVQCPSLCC